MNWTAGTVTAVGSDSVTIKTSSGTKTYGVTSGSDIDKNGEAKLSDLVSGDAVRFTTTTSNGKTVIAILHAGDEAKDMPAGMPPGRPHGMPNGGPPNGTPPSGTAPTGAPSAGSSSSGG
jgi:hypothetical protein